MLNRLCFAKSTSSGEFKPGSSGIIQSPGTVDAIGGASFFLPVQYEVNYKYPLVIWLHSDGLNQSQMIDVLPEISLQNYIGAGIRAPIATDAMGHGFRWLESDSGIAMTEEMIFATIEAASERFEMPFERICLMGHRQGGTMAMRIALRNPTKFTGVASLGGRFPMGWQPFAKLAQARSLPLMLALGSDESEYPTDDLCRDLRTLHAARLGLSVRQYDVRDNLHPRILRDMNQWLMAQITGVDTLETETMCDTQPIEFSSN